VVTGFSKWSFAAAVAVGLVVSPPAPVVAAEDTEAAPTRVQVKVRIIETDGSEVELPGQRIEVGEDAELVAKTDEHEHRVAMTVTSASTAGPVAVSLGYVRDGSTVIARKDVSAAADKPTDVASADGKFKVRLSIKPEPPREKIAPPENDDPLGGL
jgi:hypothetical protein